MKTRSIALAAHQALGSTTLAWCWLVTRKDLVQLAVTTCARDLLFEGVIYRSKDGFNPKAIAQEATAAVVNTEVDGFLSDEITEDDLAQGLWDSADVEIFEVNYRDLSMGKMKIGRFTMGDVKAGFSAFNAELRGMTQSLQKQVGRVYTKGCPWKFGDAATCRFDVEALRVAGTITSVTDLRTFADSSRAEASDYFGAGRILWVTGANEGVESEIYSFASGVFVLHLQLWQNVAVGDTYTVVPGCRRRYTEDCRTKWANTNNFGGFDKVPGNDKQLGLGGTEGNSQ
jgi:uncharacterized phage protein (TIGR02218 family)